MTIELFDYEAGYLDAGLEQLKTYLLSDEVFWNLGLQTPKGRAPYPQLTLGNLLLAEAKARAAATSSEERAKIKKLSEQLEAQRRDWRSAWEAKADKEFGVRLRQWERTIQAMSETQGPVGNLANELRVRAGMDLLKPYLSGEGTKQAAQLGALDSQLKRATSEAEFVWEEGVKGAFPKEEYWYLWRGPKEQN